MSRNSAGTRNILGMRRGGRAGPYKQPARCADEPVSQVEIQAILNWAAEAWQGGVVDGVRYGAPILVLQCAPTDLAEGQHLRHAAIVAGWFVDGAGLRALSAQEAERLRDSIESDGVVFDPAFIAFAPVVGTNHLVLERVMGPKMGFSLAIEVGRRGGMRAVKFLWMS